MARSNDDIRDLPFVLDAVNDALETARTNVQVPWKNPATGNSGVIIVEKTFYSTPEMPCRQYRRTYNQPGKGEMMTRGTGWVRVQALRRLAAQTKDPKDEAAAKSFAAFLDSPLRVVLEVVPEKWITYDGDKMARDSAGQLADDEKRAPMESDAVRMKRELERRGLG